MTNSPDLVNELEDFAMLALRLFHSPLFGHVPEDQDDADRLALFVPDRCRAVRNGPLRAVVGDEDRAVGQSDDPAFLQYLGYGVLDGSATLFIDDGEH